MVEKNNLAGADIETMVSVSEGSQTNADVVIEVRQLGIGWQIPVASEWHAYIERGFRHACRWFQSWKPTDLFFFISHDRLPTSHLYPQLLVIIPPVSNMAPWRHR